MQVWEQQYSSALWKKQKDLARQASKSRKQIKQVQRRTGE